MTNKFLSCDWGTTNFRLRLVSVPDLKILCEDSNDKGVSEIFKAWQQQDEDDAEKRQEFYREVIDASISRLESDYGDSLDGVPVVISGMASSTIGMMDIPYQALPFAIDGSGLKVQTIKATDDFNHEMLLISGVRSDDDVMRGEETQLVGTITDEMAAAGGTQLVIHPGTHSKHITIEGGQVTAFTTYMTGEFFKLLRTHGILGSSVEKLPDGEDAMQQFEQGVKDAQGANLLHAAFMVRTNDLFMRMTKGENYAYLSGLLIGTELQVLQSEQGKIYLAAGTSLLDHYQRALQALGFADKVVVFPAQAVEESVVRGQYKILSSQLNG